MTSALSIIVSAEEELFSKGLVRCRPHGKTGESGICQASTPLLYDLQAAVRSVYQRLWCECGGGRRQRGKLVLHSGASGDPDEQWSRLLPDRLSVLRHDEASAVEAKRPLEKA